MFNIQIYKKKTVFLLLLKLLLVMNDCATIVLKTMPE